MNYNSTLNQKILALADQCVKCGLCSTQCPTYRLKKDENESPRGRIALVQAFASHAISADNTAFQHIDNCLLCRRCEAICPSEVNYNEIIELTHELRTQQTPPAKLKVLAIQLISTLPHKRWQILSAIGSLILRSRILQILRFNQHGKKMLSALPQTQHSFHRITTHKNEKNERVLFFTGCISHLADQRTIDACKNLLEQCGYAVTTPNDQVCCGAIAAREGLATFTQQCKTTNQRVFTDTNNSPILFFTPGCGSKLKEYSHQQASKDNFSSRAINITTFLLNSGRLKHLPLRPLKKKVLVFTSCSEENALKELGVVNKLLQFIPDVTLLSLPANIGCCGASGLHVLTHRQQAVAIRSPIIDAITQLAPDIIVSPNYPCSLHITQGLKEKNLDIPLIHPIELILNQLSPSE